MNEREYNLSQMQRALGPLKTINDLYDSAISVNQQRNAEVMRTTSLNEGARKETIIAAAAYCFFTLIFGMGSIANILVEHKPNDLFSFLIGMALIIGFVPAMKRFKAKYVNSKESLPNLKPYDDALNDISRSIERTAKQYANEINVLPRDYRNYDAASFFEHAFANFRANTMTEAVNLYETHLHQRRQEEHNRLMLIDSQRQSEMLASIERSAHQAAVASTVSATFSVLNFLSRA